MSTYRWQKSTHSGDSSNCVEVAATATTVLIRDSKQPDATRLTIAPTAWGPFLSYAASTATDRRTASY